MFRLICKANMSSSSSDDLTLESGYPYPYLMRQSWENGWLTSSCNLLIHMLESPHVKHIHEVCNATEETFQLDGSNSIWPTKCALSFQMPWFPWPGAHSLLSPPKGRNCFSMAAIHKALPIVLWVPFHWGLKSQPFSQ